MTMAMRIAALALLGIGLAGLALATGSQPLDAPTLARALTGNGDPAATLIVWSIRLPRLTLAALAGAALALAGAALQGVTRNGLADPGVLGLTAGAGFAVTMLTWAQAEGMQAGPTWRPAAAFAGAAAAALLTTLGAWRGGTAAPMRLLLVGIGVNALVGAATLVIAMRLDHQLYAAAAVWLSGSLSGVGWAASMTLAPWIGLLATALVTQARSLDLLALGDETAAGRGLSVDAARLRIAAIAVGLAAGGVAFSGGIGFVGLVAPHMARLVVGPRHATALPAAAICGATMTVMADLIGRSLLAPVELPAGVVAAALGAPWFIWLLWRSEGTRR